MVQKNYFQTDEGSFVIVRSYKVSKTEEMAKVAVSTNNHHVFLIDGSGSMHYVMNELALRFIEMTKTKLKKGDTLTVIIFNDSFRTVFQQFLIVEDVSDFIERTTKKEFYASGLTGFAAPVNHLIDGNILSMMKDYKNIPIKLYFMSDGGDNMSGGLNRILEAFSRIKGFIKTGNTHVEGFGDWYDKNVLTKIAEHMNGIFVHTSNLNEYMDSISNFVDERETGIQTKVDISDYGDMTFVLNKDNGNIISLEPGTKSFTVSAENFLVVTHTLNRPTTVKKISVLDEDALKAAYALAIQASRSNKMDLAISVLSGNAKDKFFAEILDVSQTDQLMSVSENQILSAITDQNFRYQDGKGKFLKDPNKEDVGEVLFIIAEDGGAFIRKPINYDHISLRPHYLKDRIVTDSEGKTSKRPYGKFVSEDSEWAPFNENSIHFDTTKDTANLTILYTEKGYVEVSQEDVMEFNLQPKIKDVVKFTNYTLFDGKGTFRFRDEKGINAIFIKNIKEETYNKLKSIKAIHGSASYAPDKIFRIRLDRFPIINRSKANSISAVDYGKLMAEEKVIQTENRVIKYFLDKLNPEKAMSSRFSDDELEALKNVAGVNANGQYSGFFKDIDKEIVSKILTNMGIDYSTYLPEFKTKEKVGTKKTFEDLTADELRQLLVDLNLITSDLTFTFKGNLELDSSESFNTIPTISKLKEDLLFKDSFAFDFIKEKGLNPITLAEKVIAAYNVDAKRKIDLTNITKALNDKIVAKADSLKISSADFIASDEGQRFIINEKLTKALKEELFKEASIDYESLEVENILSFSSSIAAIKELTNPFEIKMVKLFEEFILATNGLTREEQIAFFEDKLSNNKKRQSLISKEKFYIKLAFIIGKKGFVDQTDRFNPTPVDFVFENQKYKFTPIVEQLTIFSGSLTSIMERAGVSIN